MKKTVQIILLASAGIVFGQIMTSAQIDLKGRPNPIEERSVCTANLTAQNPDARINLRFGPGTGYQSIGYGLVGDKVYVLPPLPPSVSVVTDYQGKVWYLVHFPESGAEGWIRGDFLRIVCSSD